jgi:hypothetical protein
LQDAATFFGVDPLPAIDGEILNNVAARDMINDSNYKLLTRYMDLTMDPVPAEESAAVDDFVVHLLTLLGYVPRTGRMICTHVDILLVICGQECQAKTDVTVCIVNSDDIMFLVQEDKRHKEPKDPEAQLIAEAIAAFQTNNHRRTRILGQDPIAHNLKVMPGITLKGTSPMFYRIPVTTELAQSVALGLYPATPTVVHAHLPVVARPAHRLSEGMKPLDNRASILACYEAFKRFVNWWVPQE